MNNKKCEKEDQIISKYLSDSMSDFDNQHVEECTGCKEAISISTFLNNIGKEITPPLNLSNSGNLFAVAKTTYNSEQKEMVLKPIKFMNYVFGIISAVMLFTFGYMSKDMLEELYNSDTISKYMNFSIDLSGFSINLSSFSWIYTSIIGKLLIGATFVLILSMTLIMIFDQYENKHIGIGKH